MGEGAHFIIPWVQRPVTYNIRTRPRSVPTVTGSKGIRKNYNPNSKHCVV